MSFAAIVYSNIGVAPNIISSKNLDLAPLTKLRQTFSARAGHVRFSGDLDFSSFAEEDSAGRHAVDAAVLVAVTTRPEPTILLTTRAGTLAQHAGQVAFPGGRVEATDRGLVETALREAQEEIGLPPDVVEIVGVQRPYRTGSGFSVYPVVGIVPKGLSYQIEPAEVANLFEVPMAFLFDEGNYEKHHTFYKGRMRTYYSTHWEGHHIWGATAGMLLNLAARFA